MQKLRRIDSGASLWCAEAGMWFRDLGHKNADVEQFKAILAAEIIKALDCEGLTVRAAHDPHRHRSKPTSRASATRTWGRFTVDRLMSIISRLGSRVDVKVRVRRAEPVGCAATA